MLSGLFRNKSRQNMFYESLTNENLNKVFLIFQTILLLSVIFYCYAVHEGYLSITNPSQMALFLGKCTLALILFFLYKFLSYRLAGAIFFKREAVIQWNDNFFTLISLNGIFLFLPTLVFFYAEKIYTFYLYFLLFYLIFNLFFIFYKLYTIFFQGKQLLLYFILYLCTQEIIPLYLMYRGFVYFIEQKNTIWM